MVVGKLIVDRLDLDRECLQAIRFRRYALASVMTFTNGRCHLLDLRRIFLIASRLLETNDRIITMACSFRVRLSFHIGTIPVGLTRLSANEFCFHGITYFMREGTRIRRRTKAVAPVVLRRIGVQIMRKLVIV